MAKAQEEKQQLLRDIDQLLKQLDHSQSDSLALTDKVITVVVTSLILASLSSDVFSVLVECGRERCRQIRGGKQGAKPLRHVTAQQFRRTGARE